MLGLPDFMGLSREMDRGDWAFTRVFAGEVDAINQAGQAQLKPTAVAGMVEIQADVARGEVHFERDGDDILPARY